MRQLSALLVIPVGLVACSNDFAPYSELDRLRVLAIQAEPATPLPGEKAALSALTFAPAGQGVAYHWTWCPAAAPAGNDYVCPLSQAEADQAFAFALDPSVASEMPSLDLGSSETASFVNPFALSALAGLCATGLASLIYSQSFDCEGGFPVTIVLDVATASATLRAGFVLPLPFGDTPEVNHNPYPTGMELGGAPLVEPPVAITVAPGQTIDLHVDIPADALEIRSIPPSEGPPGQRLERLTASWFAVSGKIDKARTSFIDGETTLDQTASNSWTSPKAADWPASGLVEFAVVLRDDRGGVGWLVRQAVLEQGP
ncbi:MAG TPA: hypothetical protein VIM14_01855 [Polyangia bacterium]